MFVGKVPVAVSKVKESFGELLVNGDGILVSLPNFTVGGGGPGGKIFKYNDIPAPKRILPIVRKTMK